LRRDPTKLCSRGSIHVAGPRRRRESGHHVNGRKTLRSELRWWRVLTCPIESKPNSRMIKANTIAVMPMASSIIDKKLRRRGCRGEHRGTDLRRRTRRKSPSLSLGRLDLSSWYFLKNSKIDISQKDEISCECFRPSRAAQSQRRCRRHLHLLKTSKPSAAKNTRTPPSAASN
jgi:hypothetical protein